MFSQFTQQNGQSTLCQVTFSIYEVIGSSDGFANAAQVNNHTAVL
jgi:hypothetical protein